MEQHVCFTPMNSNSQCEAALPGRAKSGLMHRSKKGRGEEDKDDNLESP
jgi:hypothetical protein